jgi:carbon monoxide dehydrogenase subunit G
MRIEGNLSVAAAKADVWAVLTDPKRITPLLPGGEILAQDDTTWRARLSAPTALGDSSFNFTFNLVEQRPDEYVRITGHGDGSQNVIDLTADLSLSEHNGGTEVLWRSDVRLRGVLASLGQRSLPYVLRDKIEGVLKAIEAQRSGASA